MTTKAAAEPKQGGTEATPTTTEEGFDALPEKTKAEIRRIRAENKARRTENDELKKQNEGLQKKADEFDDFQKKQAEEQGKYKELADKLEGENKELKGYKKRVSEYEKVFKAELDNELKAMTPEHVEVVNMSGLPVEKKLEMARKLKAGTPGPNSPAAQRPGGGVTETDEKLLKDIREEKDKVKQAKMLMDLKAKHPDLYTKYGKE